MWAEPGGLGGGLDLDLPLRNSSWLMDQPCDLPLSDRWPLSERCWEAVGRPRGFRGEFWLRLCGLGPWVPGGSAVWCSSHPPSAAVSSFSSSSELCFSSPGGA